jgi:hypothetical protein
MVHIHPPLSKGPDALQQGWRWRHLPNRLISRFVVLSDCCTCRVDAHAQSSEICIAAPYRGQPGASVADLAISLSCTTVGHRHHAFRTIARPVPNSFSLASLHRIVTNRTSATSRRTRHTLVPKMLQQASPILNRISAMTSICTLPSGRSQYS